MHWCPSKSCQDSGSEVVQPLGPGIVRTDMIGEKRAISMGRPDLSFYPDRQGMVLELYSLESNINRKD